MSNIVLLDTGVVSGLLSDDAKKSQAWNQSISKVLAIVSGGRYAIPTPVWFELAQWHDAWYKKIQEEVAKRSARTQNPIYEFAGYAIANSVLFDAAWYRNRCRSSENSKDLGNYQDKKEKIGFIDSLIAAYCLRFGHYVLTLNQQDFPEKYFELVDIWASPRSTKLQRDFISLLKPKTKDWSKSKNT